MAFALLAAVAVTGAQHGSSLPPEKQAIIDAENERLNQAYQVTPVPGILDVTPDPEETLGVQLTGQPAGDGEIHNRKPTLFVNKGSNYDLKNFWLATIGGAEIRVQAGGLTDDPAQGLVIVIVRDAYGNRSTDVRNGVYLTQIKAGPLRVVGADGMSVHLKSSSGIDFVFNAGEGRFVSPFLGPLPTASPVATLAPTATPLPAVAFAAVDVLVSDRSPSQATEARTVESCRTASVGELLEVDVVIEGLPAVRGETIGIIGFQFTLVFDPTRVRVTGVNTSMLLNSSRESDVLDTSDSPDAGGAFGEFVVGAVDASPDVPGAAESTGGALARISLEVVGDGVSAITIEDGAIIETNNLASPFVDIASATIVTGGACPEHF